MAGENKGKIVVSKDGPYLVSGKLPLAKEIIVCARSGEPVEWKKGDKFPDKEAYSLCRCGKSKNKPYCDGMHAKAGFDGTETADDRKCLEKAEKTEGPGLVLTDAPALCAGARFCHLGGGTWELTEKSGDPQKKKLAIREACDCPSGRLVAWDKGKPIEPKFRKSLSLVEDPCAECSGPIWVKGGVQVQSADGKKYMVRNRVTLCRCGNSRNKPFCDGSHIDAKFSDENEK